MSGIDIEALGFTKEDVMNRIVDRYIDSLQITRKTDEDGDPIEVYSHFHRAMEAHITAAIDAEVSRIGEKFVIPKMTEMVESHIIQQTNKWGQPISEPITFTEYLVKRAEEFISEKVNYEGKSKSETSSSYFDPKQTRIAHLIDKHLHYSIDTAVRKALADLNSAVAKGLATTVQIKIEETLQKLRVETKVV